jgi:3-methyladenine DNA glycosylase AlkD
MSLAALKKALRIEVDTVYKETQQRFFKTEKGQYGAGDKFLGIRVPILRKISRAFSALTLNELSLLLHSAYHEERAIALFILILQYQRSESHKDYFEFYLAHKNRVNNWDLVDNSAPAIVGHYLVARPKDLLYKLIKSHNLWDRRIAMVSTQYFIRQKKLNDTFALAKLLLDDKEDLMHKAAGWMLREAGKVDEALLIQFLETHAHAMPRTMLRYAIEKFSVQKRRYFLDFSAS